MHHSAIRLSLIKMNRTTNLMDLNIFENCTRVTLTLLYVADATICIRKSIEFMEKKLWFNQQICTSNWIICRHFKSIDIIKFFFALIQHCLLHRRYWHNSVWEGDWKWFCSHLSSHKDQINSCWALVFAIDPNACCAFISISICIKT